MGCVANCSIRVRVRENYYDRGRLGQCPANGEVVLRDGGYEVVEAMDGCFLTDLNMKQQGKAAGATGWIVKPFTPDQLLAVAKKVMR